MRNSWILLGVLTLGGSGAIAQQSVVVTGEPVPSRIVSFADLNIASPAGQDRLVHRIRAAARDLCFENNVEPMKVAAARHRCYYTAVGGGLEQMSRAIAARASGTALAAATTLIIRDR